MIPPATALCRLMSGNLVIVSEPLIKSWFALQRQLIAGLQLAYVDLQGSGVPAGGLFVTYPDGIDRPGELAMAAELARRSGAPVTGRGAEIADGNTALRIACPLHLGPHADGAVVVEVEAPLERQVAIIELLKWGEAWLNLAIRQLGEGAPAPTFGDVIQAGLDQADYRDAVTAILGLLPARVPCTRVSLGRPRGERMLVEAVSGIGKLNPRSKRVRGMGRVMQEALDAGTALHYQDGADDPATARQRLVRGARLSGLCSVPLIAGMPEPVVLLFEFADDAPWTADSPQRCSEAAHAVIPLIELRREQGRPWWRRLQALVAQGVQRLAGAKGRARRIAVLAGVVLLALLAVGRQPYRVSAPAVVEGAVQQAVVAPFEGFIAEAAFRAGQTVAEGDLLARLDDRDLKTDQRRLRAEEAELIKQHRQAVATLDHGEAKVVEAQLEQTRARLALVDAQRERTALRAPFDGVVISGDWSRSLGVPVARGELLFEIAPLHDYRVALQVSDRDIAALATGQQGELVLSALPRTDLQLAVTNIASLAADAVAEPAFRVEAELVEPLPGLRPGMQGVAKVAVGERRRWWIWTHALRDWLGLQLWRWRP